MGDLDNWMDEAFIKTVFGNAIGDTVSVKIIRDRQSGYVFFVLAVHLLYILSFVPLRHQGPSMSLRSSCNLTCPLPLPKDVCEWTLPVALLLSNHLYSCPFKNPARLLAIEDLCWSAYLVSFKNFPTNINLKTFHSQLPQLSLLSCSYNCVLIATETPVTASSSSLPPRLPPRH